METIEIDGLLDFEEGSHSKILNTKSGMTFCIQVGKTDDETSQENREWLNRSPAILLKTSDQDFEEMVNHEISEEINVLDELSMDDFDDSCDDDIDGSTSTNDGLESNFGDGLQFLKYVPPLSESVFLDANDLLNPSNLERLHRKRVNCQFPVTKHKGELIWGPKRNNSTPKTLGMKIMTGNNELVMKSFYAKGSDKGSFTVDPSMLSCPLVLKRTEDSFSPLQTILKGTETIKRPKSKIIHPKIKLIKHNKNLSDSALENMSTSSTYSRIIKWDEGNIDQVDGYLTISRNLKQKYYKPILNTSTTTCPTPVTNGTKYNNSEHRNELSREAAATGINILLSWEAVKERLKELEVETFTKYIFDYKNSAFQDDPVPFKKILFSMNLIRKGIEVVIPKNGIPFIFLGQCVFICHLGKKRYSKRNSDIDILEKPVKSKKIGCPAFISIVRIARLPDYDISCFDPKCEAEVLKELKDHWDLQHSKVRYYIEYHMKEPGINDHVGHEVQYLVSGTKFQEPVDRRIIEKMKDLAKNGYSSMKAVEREIQNYVRNELFQGNTPPLARRRYNPTKNDIRYALSRAKEELKKEGRSVVQLECSSIASEISEAVRNITDETCLNNLHSHLSHLLKVVQDPNSHESFNQRILETDLTQKARKRKLSSNSTLEKNNSSFNESEEQDGIIEQFYVNVPPGPEPLNPIFGDHLDFPDLEVGTTREMDALQVSEDGTVTEVYYYYPDGTCELANAGVLAPVSN